MSSISISHAKPRGDRETHLTSSESAAVRGSTPVRHCRQAFTLIELLIVMLVIIGLLGIGMPVYFSVIKGIPAQRTDVLVRAIHAAIGTYIGGSTISIPNGGMRRLWDFDGDGVLDGDPALFSEPFRTQAATAGYRGFLAMTGTALEKRNVDSVTGQVVDGWKRPLRISFANGGSDFTYGPSGVGVWSFGSAGPAVADPTQPANPAAIIASWKGR